MKTLFTVLFCVLVVTSVYADNFSDIRSQSTYWMPYKIGDITIIINKHMDRLTNPEVIKLNEMIAVCHREKHPFPHAFYWVEEDMLEGMVTKNWPEIDRARYPADINEIMLMTKRPRFLYKNFDREIGIWNNIFDD